MWKVILVASSVAFAGCASTSPPEAVSTTTTTGADGVELYRARAERGVCRSDLPSTVPFSSGSTVLSTPAIEALDAWASCLRQKKLEHATIVLVGSEEAGASEIFEQRAAVVRQALAERGVDIERIVVAAPNATREGGRGATNEGVRLELSGLDYIRHFGTSPARRAR